LKCIHTFKLQWMDMTWISRYLPILRMYIIISSNYRRISWELYAENQSRKM
jgi:hypothetical protein